MVSTRFPVLLRGGSDQEEALGILFVGDISTDTVQPGDVHRVDAAFDQPALLIAGVPWKAQGTYYSGARGTCGATGRATYGAWLWRERP